MEKDHLLQVKGLCTHFPTEKGRVTAVSHVSFHIDKGEVLGIVGESGCGKSVTAESIMRLLNEKGGVFYEGEILYEGENLLQMSEDEMRNIRGNKISMIFQDPMSSLNPVYTVGNQIIEGLVNHQKLSKKNAYQKAVEMLKLTGIPSPEKRVHQYPHELSGGMRQRAMIALALACRPTLLIADEPTTALDVTTQAQILEVLEDLKNELNMATIMITHDLGVVAEVCSRVIVMYLGQVIEEAEVEELFDRPLHPYTRGLLRSIPQLDGDREQKLHVIEGMVPTLHDVPTGCRFVARCKYADEQCHQEEPVFSFVTEQHAVRCWHYEKIEKQEADHSEAPH
ncbi:ABC transporter ATP-binding protein [Bacillus horti]|uniref:Oligopeptide/dipeptide ABC transporter ATP-binding protein n=1 Tax=Caldalkalibacillus horti TaxID=77523 RepID=A0ABT9VVH5_9BACI|nr:ABC transporter ATP-binding protein [Bacillus horti]MDQ0164884.1 oligopeptide/dipeptide ABC transporter ATP-binding protein [Bacillus horti]